MGESDLKKRANILTQQVFRDISLCADMAFVFVVKLNESLITKIFKFLQLLVFDLIDLRRG